MPGRPSRHERIAELTAGDGASRSDRRPSAPDGRIPRGGREHSIRVEGHERLPVACDVAGLAHARDVLLGVHTREILERCLSTFPLLGDVVQRDELTSHRRGERSQTALVLGVPPPRVVQLRGGVEIEAGGRWHCSVAKRRQAPRATRSALGSSARPAPASPWR